MSPLDRHRPSMATGRTFVIFAILTASSLAASAQRLGCKGTFDYGNRNQVDPASISLRSVQGRVFIDRDSASDRTSVPGCLAVFTESGHRLLAIGITDRYGRFSFPGIRPGNYRLVVRDPQNAFCLANAKIRITSAAPPLRRLKVHLLPAGIDTCSFIT